MSRHSITLFLSDMEQRSTPFFNLPTIAWFAYPPERKLKPKTKKASKLKAKQKAAHDSLLTLRDLGLGGGVDPEEERDPPPKPTKVTFPADVQLNHSYWNGNTPPPKLFNLFSKIRQPSDLTTAHVEALNIVLNPDCAFDALVPLAEDGTSFLPSVDPQQVDSTTQHADTTASRKQGDFAKRYAELQYDNRQAFSVINRTFKDGKAPRVAFLRRFWEGLEDMSRYWDCSMDCYFETDAPEDQEKRAKRQRMEEVTDSGRLGVEINLDDQTLPGSERHGLTEQNDESRAGTLSLPDLYQDQKCEEHVGSQFDLSEASIKPISDGSRQDSIFESPGESQEIANPPKMLKRYKGCRTSTGRDMPDSSRSSTVHGFMEAVAWPFSFSVSSPKVPPRLQLGNLVLPVRQNAAVYRVPKDRARGRKGFVEGPVIGIQTRPETGFGKGGPEETLATARLDLLREFAALLHIAQERNREGKIMEMPGEGKWWTSTPRWGTGAASNDHASFHGPEPAALAGKTVAETQPPRKKVYSSRASKKTPLEVWEDIKCGSSLWDPKTEYIKIGKEPHSEYDQVSSRYHTHLKSILTPARSS